MSKKNRKTIKSKNKREPRLTKKRRHEKVSWRNSWIASLTVIVLIAGLSIFWYVRGVIDAPFESKFAVFTCEIPDGWTSSYDINETIQFDGNLGNCAHSHMFSPKGVDLGVGQTNREMNIKLNPEEMKTLQDSVDDPISKGDRMLKEKISRQISSEEPPKSREEVIEEMESLTILTASIFLPNTPIEKLNQFLNGIGGLKYPQEYFLEELEKEGNKMPNVDYGYYSIGEGGHPVGILKDNGSTVIFNGIVSEKRVEDVESIFKSIRTP